LSDESVRKLFVDVILNFVGFLMDIQQLYKQRLDDLMTVQHGIKQLTPLCSVCFGSTDQFSQLAVLDLPLMFGPNAFMDQIIIGEHRQFKHTPDNLIGAFFKGGGLPKMDKDIGQHDQAKSHGKRGNEHGDFQLALDLQG
jgi:hypothetical protein